MGQNCSVNAHYTVDGEINENLSASQRGESGMVSPHSGGILGLCSISDDEFVCCSDDKSISKNDWRENLSRNTDKLWKGHKNAVNRVCVSSSSSGTSVWSVSRDLSVRQWDIASGKQLQMIEKAHTLNISSVAACMDGSRVATGSRDYSVKVWDSGTGTCVAEYKRPRNIVTCMTFSASDPSGRLLYQGAEDLAVRLWDTRMSGGSPAATLSGYVYFPLSMDINAAGTLLATGCKGFDDLGADVKVWDLRRTTSSSSSSSSSGGKGDSGKGAHDAPHFTYERHGMDACGVSFLGDDHILSVGKDGSLMLSHPTLSEGSDGGSSSNPSRHLFPGVISRHAVALSVAPESKVARHAPSSSGGKAIYTAAVGYLGGGKVQRVAVVHGGGEWDVQVIQTMANEEENDITF